MNEKRYFAVELGSDAAGKLPPALRDRVGYGATLVLLDREGVPIWSSRDENVPTPDLAARAREVAVVVLEDEGVVVYKHAVTGMASVLAALEDFGVSIKAEDVAVAS